MRRDGKAACPIEAKWFEDIRGALAGFESSRRVLPDAVAWLITARAA